jgi:hypothetical protein
MLTLRIEPSLVAQVKREAKMRDCSIAMVIRDALRFYFHAQSKDRRIA